MEGQNPLVVSLGIPPCGGDRGMVRGGDGDVTPFAAIQVPHQRYRFGPGGVGRDASP